ncbi:NGFI-A-binding protein homolog isoform X6 [Portunus trituberculatus]|uniref:NGFI-A-binding protein homolog isoform X6 n=1 Tax=Portunus trituberculatus TaxID=210409 RepID=UPI001E1D2182|nr:NGFI-A-binding protein homolog isoform X6 [Portunus trituberculatus]
MLLVPPTSRTAPFAEPLVPPTTESSGSVAAYPNHTLVPVKVEPSHPRYPPHHPPLPDIHLRPHMSGLSETQYPPASTATHSAPTTPAPPSTPTPAPTVSAPSDRSGSGGSASGGPLPILPPTVVGPSTGSIVPTSSSSGPVGALTPAMPVPGPSNPQSQPPPSQQQGPQGHHPLLGYVNHGNKIVSRNLNGTRPNYPPISQTDRRPESIRRAQDYGHPSKLSQAPPVPPPLSMSSFAAAAAAAATAAPGLMAVTSQPSNESELQLYRVLQRANLLNYYDTFISQGRVKGGDDVQQLCEAGEEEFLEIMALVGMASKPLHVRRLQKALQEWVSNPAMFQIPLMPNLPPSVAAGFPALTGRGLMGTPTPTPTPTRPSPPMITASIHPNHNSSPGITKDSMPNMNSNSVGGVRDVSGVPSTHSLPLTTASTTPALPTSTIAGCTSNARDGPLGLGAAGMGGPMPGMGGAPIGGMGAGTGGGIGGSRGPSPHHTSPTHPGIIPPTSVGLQNCHGTMSADKNAEFFLPLMKSTGVEHHHQYPPPPGSPLQLTPVLLNSQVDRLADTAYELVRNLPPFEPKTQQQLNNNNKRKMSKELEYIMNMSEDDPRRMEEIRKYAAIYGRFDCKRKPEKPLTLHEVSVNEAAAQICKYMPALLTRRDELFPLARQVVRDSGYQYSKGHSRSQTVVGGREDEPKNKRSRSDSGHDAGDLKNDLQWKKRQERLEAISEELRHMSERAEEVRTSLSSGSGDVTALTSQMDALQTRHSQLTLEQNELLKAQRKAKSDRVSVCSEDRERGEDSDSQFSYSGASSPSQSYLQQLVQDTLVDEGLRVVKESLNQQKDPVSGARNQDSSSYPRAPPQQGLQQDGVGAKHNSTPSGTVPTSTSAAQGRLVSPPTTYSEMFSYPENKVRKVLSSSQGNIIAVANPALSMSAAMANSQLSDEERHISALYTLSQTAGASATSRSNSIKQEPNSPGATKQE